MKQSIFIGLVAAILVSGCALFRRGAETSTTPVALGPDQRFESLVPGLSAPTWSATQFDDVPVPPEFTLDYDASYINVSGQGLRVRVADLRYTGEAPLTEALASVQQGMLRSGWRLTSLTGVAIKSLRFVKGEEECQVIVREGDGGETVLVVRLQPRP